MPVGLHSPSRLTARFWPTSLFLCATTNTWSTGLNSNGAQVQGDSNYMVLNIQIVSQAAEYISRDAKQKQLAARQPKECQTNGRYLTQSTAIQGQSVRQRDESLASKAASITRLLDNALPNIKKYFLHVSSTRRTLRIG